MIDQPVTLLMIFILSAFVGIEVISKVPSILHTPLMSGSNAIHGVILVGAMIIANEAHGPLEVTLALIAVVLATLNIVGGVTVTDRMLEMFKGRGQVARPRTAEAGPGAAGAPAAAAPAATAPAATTAAAPKTAASSPAPAPAAPAPAAPAPTTAQTPVAPAETPPAQPPPPAPTPSEADPAPAPPTDEPSAPGTEA